MKTKKGYQFFISDCESCIFRFNTSRCMVADNCENREEYFSYDVLDENNYPIYDNTPYWCPMKKHDIIWSIKKDEKDIKDEM